MNKPGTTLSALPVGTRIRIVQSFRDFDGQQIVAGTELVLVKRHVFPYDDGHTLTFEPNTVIRLSGNQPDDARVLDDKTGQWWQRVEDSAPST